MVVQGRTQRQRRGQPQQLTGGFVQDRGDDDFTGVCDGDEALVEGCVEVGSEQEAVEDVEALGVDGAGAHGLMWLARRSSETAHGP